MAKARVTFSNGKTATITGTKEEIQGAVQAYEQELSGAQNPPGEPTSEGQKVYDAATSGPVYDQAWLKDQLQRHSPSEPIPTMNPGEGVRKPFSPMAQPQQSEEVAAPTPEPAPFGSETPVPTFPDPNAVQHPYKQSYDDWKDELRTQIEAPFRMGWEGIKGALDLGGSIITGAAGQAVGGWAGIAAQQAKNMGLNADPSRAVENVSSMIATQPMTETGRQEAAALTVPMAKLDQVTRDVSWGISGGNPELATAAYTLLNALPTGRGTSALPKRLATNAARRDIEQFYLNRGITLGADKMDEAMQKWSEKEFSDIPRERGRSMAMLPNELQQREQALQGRIAATNTAIAESQGSVSMVGVTEARDRVVKKLTDEFPASTMELPQIKEILAEWDGLLKQEKAHAKAPDSATNYRKWQKLQGIRTRLENYGSNNATQVVRDGMDDFINTQVANGLVRGDKFLTGNTQLAADLKAQYDRQFKPKTEIYRMATNLNASPEDFRKYIFGLSDTGFKTEAAQVVKQLADIFGKNSPQMNALRMEFLSDAIEPLRGFNGKGPDLDAFITHYEKVTRNNDTLIKELSPYMRDGLKEMYDLAIVARKTGSTSRFTLNPLKIIPRILVGHQIARKGALVNASQQLAEAIFGRSEKAVRRDMLNQLSGFDSQAPMFLNGTTRLQALWASAIEGEYNDSDTD